MERNVAVSSFIQVGSDKVVPAQESSSVDCALDTRITNITYNVGKRKMKKKLKVFGSTEMKTFFTDKTIRSLAVTMGLRAVGKNGKMIPQQILDKKRAGGKKLDARYELPDETSITVSSERYLVPEAMFNPKLLGKEGQGLHQAVHKSIMQCEENIREHLFANIILSGGNMQFPGMAERLHYELKTLAAPDTKIKVVAAGGGANASWFGAGLMASLPIMDDLWITEQDYHENGPRILQEKFKH